jgi:hypothetical protein
MTAEKQGTEVPALAPTKPVAKERIKIISISQLRNNTPTLNSLKQKQGNT